MTGRIPPYGERFRLERTGYIPGLASRIYILKADPGVFICSSQDSKRWHVSTHGTVTGPFRTFAKAMAAVK